MMGRSRVFSARESVVDSQPVLSVDFLRIRDVSANATEESQNGRNQSRERRAERLSKIAR